MRNPWYPLVHGFARAVYFGRVGVVHPERLPKSGPVLYVGLHRNGAADGFVYEKVLPGVVFLISTQLRKSLLGRLMFNGIALTREKDRKALNPRGETLSQGEREEPLTPALSAGEREDGERTQNEAALQECLQHLAAGGQLFVFPEGTSSLGPRHLPFKGGAAWLIEDYRKSGGPPLQVIPVGIHYECAWAFRSKVEVVIGNPICTEVEETRPLGRIKELRHRITAALEEVGINVPTAAYQDQIQQLAYVSTLGTARSWFRSLKVLERGIPGEILQAGAALEPELAGRKLWRHQGVPLFPMGWRWIYLLALLVLSPLVLAGIALNLPPFLAGWFAGRKFPDDTNVISLWRILVGVPLLALWGMGMTLTLLLTQPALALLYIALTWLALALYYRVKKLAVAAHNGYQHPELGPRLLAFRETVLGALPSENPFTAEALETTRVH